MDIYYFIFKPNYTYKLKKKITCTEYAVIVQGGEWYLY